MHRVYHRRMLATKERLLVPFGANRPAREASPKITVSREMMSMTRGLLPVAESMTAYQRYHLAKNTRGIWHAYRTDGHAIARVLVASSPSQQWELQIDNAGYPIDADQVLISPTLISSFDAAYCVPMTARTVDGDLYLHGNRVDAKPSPWSPPLKTRHPDTFARALKWLGGSDSGIEVGIGVENGVLTLNKIVIRRIDGTRAVLVALRRVGA